MIFTAFAVSVSCLPACAQNSSLLPEVAEAASQPLTARVNLDIRDIKQKERFRTNLSPILIDARESEQLSLEKVIYLAANRNLSYLQNKWLGRSANYAFLGSIGSLNAFTFSENTQNLGILQNPNPSQGTPPQNLFAQNLPYDRLRYYTYGVNLSTGGGVFIGLMNNYFRSRVVAASVRTSMQDTLSEACSNYFTLCRDISLLHVNDIVVENSRGIRDLNQGLLDCGMGTRLQLLQAETQLAQDRQQMVLQQVQARVSAINLAVTLNVPVSCYLLPHSRPLEKITLVDPRMPVERLVQLALNQRPEIAKAKNQIKLDVAQATQAITPIIPSASYIVTSGEFFPQNNGNAISGKQRNLQLSWQLNNLGVPILPNLMSGMATARSDQYALKNLELQIRAQVRQSYDNCLAYETNIGIARQAALEAQEQLRLAEERLKAGIGINIDVIQAQTALTGALRNYVNAIYSYNIEQVKLRRAMGGFTLESVRSKLRYSDAIMRAPR